MTDRQRSPEEAPVPAAGPAPIADPKPTDDDGAVPRPSTRTHYVPYEAIPSLAPFFRDWVRGDARATGLLPPRPGSADEAVREALRISEEPSLRGPSGWREEVAARIERNLDRLDADDR